MLQGGSTTNTYDVNNNLAVVTDSTKAANNRTLINDAGGHILQSTQNGYTQRELVVNGEVLGRYGTMLNPDKPADSSGNPLFITGSSFNFGYTKISGSYPAANPGTKVVAAGDTLASIAKSVYGDSSLWYLIADANGLSGDRDLRVGQTLTVPNRVTGAKNNSNSFKPYNPGEVVGNTTPNLPSPPSGGGGGCGGLGLVIMVVVAVAVTVYTGGTGTGAVASFWTGALGSGTAATIATGATAAALGSIASQAVGNVLGIQKGFDWNGVAMAAVSGGVGAGMGTLAGGTGALGGSGLGATMARAAIGNAMTQGIAIATGMQKEFSWTSVAASAAGAGVGHGMNEALGLTDAAGKATNAYSGMDKMARAAFSGFAAGTATVMARGGRVEVTQVAADAFGNALGNSIGEEMLRSDAQELLRKQKYSLLQYQGGGQGLKPTASAAAAFGRAVDDRIADRVWAMQEADAYDRGDYVPGGGDVDAELPGMSSGQAPGRALGGVNFSGETLPSMSQAPQLVGGGQTARGLAYEDWDSGARTTAVRQASIESTPLAQLAGEGGGLPYGSIKADQGLWASLGAIANSGLSFSDRASMAWGTTKYYFRNSDEMQGSVQMVGGGLEVTGGVTLATGGGPIGIALGTLSVAHGADNIAAGFSRAFGYGNNPTVTYQLMESATGSSRWASAIDQGIPYLTGVASVGQGLRLAEDQIFNNTAYRALTAEQSAALNEGVGLNAKNPNGLWTTEEHVLNYSATVPGGAARNNPWIATSREYETADIYRRGASGSDAGNGIVSINLGKIPSQNQVELANVVDRSTVNGNMAFHRAFWAQEVSVYQSIPMNAIGSPLSFVPVYQPITYGLTIGGTGLTSNRGKPE